MVTRLIAIVFPISRWCLRRILESSCRENFRPLLSINIADRHTSKQVNRTLHISCIFCPKRKAPSRMPVLSLSEVDIPADRIGIPSMRNPPPARVLPDESRFLAVEIIAVVAHTAPPGKLPSAANQVERFRWQHTPASRTALLCWQHPFPKPPSRHPSAHGQAIPLEAVSSLFSRRARRAARTRHTTTPRQSRQSTNRVRPLRKGSRRT